MNPPGAYGACEQPAGIAPAHARARRSLRATASFLAPAALASAVAWVCAATTLGFLGFFSFAGWLDPGLTIFLVLACTTVIAVEARSGAAAAQRITLLTGLGSVFGPRHDFHEAVLTFAEMLRVYENADLCLIVLHDARTEEWVLYEADGSENNSRHRPIAVSIAEPLLAITGDCSILYNARSWRFRPSVCEVHNAEGTVRIAATPTPAVAELAQLFEARSLISLPLRSRGGSIGRLHLIARNKRFSPRRIDFLASAADLAALVIANMQLADRLARKVADQERKKISRDLHDGTIQPYIGLKLGLEALYRRVQGDSNVAHEVKALLNITTDGIHQLRQYMGRLKSGAHDRALEPVLPAIRQQVEKFSKHYGIEADIVADDDMAVGGALLQHLMFLVREGLSNILRHTKSRRATIRLASSPGSIELQFENDNERSAAAGIAFFPRSIGERAGELGGCVDVRVGEETVVTVRIPVHGDTT